MEMLKPCSINPYVPKVGSKRLVDEFLRKNMESAEVDVISTNRSKQTVYSSLKAYLRNHLDLKVGVKMDEGRVVLFRVAT